MDAEEARLVKQDAARHMEDPFISDINTVAAARAVAENEGAVDWTSELPVHPRTRVAQSMDQRRSRAHPETAHAHPSPTHASVDISTAVGRRSLLADSKSDGPESVCYSIEGLHSQAPRRAILTYLCQTTSPQHGHPKFLHVGDWKCSYCGWWNNKYHKFCRGKRIGNPCSTMRKADDVVLPDDGEHKKRRRGRFLGDWFCGECLLWNHKYLDRCSKCGERVGVVKENEKLE
jgi:hypothetical protein